MTGEHETFLMLAARDLHEGLTAEESRILDEHLATCPSCRRAISGMRRDDATLRGMLAEAPVAPRVRTVVMDAARGRSRSRPRLVPVLAAVLLVALIGLAIVAGGLTPRPPIEPSPSASDATSGPSGSPTAEPSASSSSSASPSPTAAPSASAATGTVNGAYAYSVRPGATRRDSVSARLEGDGPSGEWSRLVPADGSGNSFGGPITCMVIDGQDAWLAGPATTASDGSTDLAVLLVVHDGGPGGDADRAVTWATDPGQTLTTMEGWCRDKFSPAEPYPLDEGNVTVTPPAE